MLMIVDSIFHCIDKTRINQRKESPIIVFFVVDFILMYIFQLRFPSSVSNLRVLVQKWKLLIFNTRKTVSRNLILLFLVHVVFHRKPVCKQPSIGQPKI